MLGTKIILMMIIIMSPQYRAQQLINQINSPENTHTNNIIWTEKVIFMNIYAYTSTHMDAKTINLKRYHEREEEGSKRGLR